MAFIDYDGDGKIDAFDDFIEYQIIMGDDEEQEDSSSDDFELSEDEIAAIDRMFDEPEPPKKRGGLLGFLGL